VFLAQWSLRSDRQRIKDALIRRKNLALIDRRMTNQLNTYKKETGWEAVNLIGTTGSVEDPHNIFNHKNE
jgi:hypothetical protein